jgi:hypothetical protein
MLLGQRFPDSKLNLEPSEPRPTESVCQTGDAARGVNGRGTHEMVGELESVSQAKELNERFVKGAEQLANAAAKSARGQSKAA